MNTKTLRFFSWIVLALLPINSVLAAPAGQLTQTAGYITVSSPQAPPKSVGSGEPIESGQTVTVGEDGRAVIKFSDGQMIALQSKSIFTVNNYKYEQAAPEKGESFFSLLQGGLRAITGLIGSSHREGWKLATPTATIGIRGTDVLVVIKQSTFLKVNTGVVSATNGAGTALFTAGQFGVIETGSTLGVILPASGVPAGTFEELSAINLSAVGGSATGTAASAGGSILGVPTGVVIGVGVAGAAAAAAGGSNNGGSTPTATTHH